MNAWTYLALAIVSEVTGTVALRQSDGFTKPIPSAIVVLGYALSFWMLALSLRKLELGLVYAVWAGVGTAAIATIGIVAFDEPANAIKLACILVIICAVIGLNLSGAG
jgi:multidrug transporter EmrE-like cation transporter